MRSLSSVFIGVFSKQSKPFNSKYNVFRFSVSTDKSKEEIQNITQINEFKEGLLNLRDKKYNEAENHLKECLRILKNSNSSETLGYNFVLKKLIQTKFKNNKFSECETLLQASIKLSEKISNHQELIFNSHRNLIAFYTYTDLDKAINYTETLLKDDKIDSNTKRFLVYALGPLYLLKNDYASSKRYLHNAISSQLPSRYIGYSLHNLSVYFNEFNKHYEMIPEEAKEKWAQQNSYKPDEFKNVDKSIIIYNKQALHKLEIFEKKKLESNDRSEIEEDLISRHLSNEDLLHKLDEANENLLINSFKSGYSGLTISNLSEFCFEKDLKKESAFWLKLGLKYCEKYEQEALPRHLILFALFYSNLGQTMVAEGIYRKSLSLLTDETDFNLVFALNMFGRLLLRQDKREKEGKDLLEKSEILSSKLPYWYNRLVKVKILDFDFD